MFNDDIISFKGTVEHVTYYNDESGYAVINVLPDSRKVSGRTDDGVVTVVGVMPELRAGEYAEFTGQWVDDRRYGLQVRLSMVRPIAPSSRAGIIRYLSSGIVRGIGEVRARRIVDHFGEDTLEILNKNPDRLNEVRGINDRLAADLAAAWVANVQNRQAMIYLQGLGMTARLATKIYKALGFDVIERVKENPYALIDAVFGIGFIKADQIARNMGIPPDSPQRLRAGLSYTLQQMTRDGHVFMPRQQLIEKATEILGYGGEPKILDALLSGAVLAGALVIEKLTFNGERIEAVYLPDYHSAEVGAVAHLQAIAETPSIITEESAKIDWDAYMRRLAGTVQTQLSEQQQSVVKAFFTGKIAVLTGGPGTGKTTTVQMLLNALDDYGYSYMLASPTGRAAKRLSETTGRDAQTIHRCLEFNPQYGGFMRDEEFPLEIDAMIVDEASMIDLKLFHSLLRGLHPQAHLLLVGDVDQLPSVGAGNVLRDVIASGAAHVTSLQTIFRQETDSQIISNAHRINNGEMPITDNSGRDFFFFGEADPFRAAELLVDVVANRIPKRFGMDAVRDVQVIAPMYRGGAGIDKLNVALRDVLNPEDRRVGQVKVFGRVLRVGDKLMQTRNNYAKGVFNGDIGYLTAIDDGAEVVKIRMGDDEIEYDYLDCDDLIHAYCISIHRSQGSEYPVVVMPLLTQHYMMLQRNLLYTAITRARQMVVLVGNRDAVRMAVKNNKVAERYSGLLARLMR